MSRTSLLWCRAVSDVARRSMFGVRLSPSSPFTVDHVRNHLSVRHQFIEPIMILLVYSSTLRALVSKVAISSNHVSRSYVHVVLVTTFSTSASGKIRSPRHQDKINQNKEKCRQGSNEHAIGHALYYPMTGRLSDYSADNSADNESYRI